MRTDDELNTIDWVNDLICTLRSSGVTYPEISAFCDIKKPETFITWANETRAPSPSLYRRIELAAELAQAIERSLGRNFRVGHVSLFLQSQPKPLRGATPSAVLLGQGPRAKLDLVLAAEHFVDDIKKGRLVLPGSLQRSSLEFRSKLEEKDAQAVRTSIQALERMHLTLAEIGRFIGDRDHRVNLLRSQQIPRVTRLEKVQLQQAAAAAATLSRHFRPARVRELLLGTSPADQYRGRSLAVIIATQGNDRASQRRVAGIIDRVVLGWTGQAATRG